MTMTFTALLHHRRTDLALRLLLGGVFIYAGLLKVLSPLTFADQIAAYKLLPFVLINHVALGLPIFEILAGALLITGWQRRLATLSLLLLTILFALFITSAIARGLRIDCGCFGSSIIPLRYQLWFALGRDLLLLAITILIARFTPPTLPTCSSERT